jgi:DNA-binding FadR family transcriptional regulator
MRVPLSRRVETQVRRYIVEHNLVPGDPLPPEGELASLLDMGKASIREGVRRLEMLGIVEVRHGRGLFVGEFSLGPVLDALPYDLAVNDTPLREILQVRCALEEGLVVQASRAMTVEDLVALDELVVRMRANSTAGEVPAEIDREFHQALFAPLGNELVSRLIDTFWTIYANFESAQPAPINHHALEDHAEIVAAIRSGDPERMVRAVAVHFAPIQSTVELDGAADFEENHS